MIVVASLPGEEIPCTGKGPAVEVVVAAPGAVDSYTPTAVEHFFAEGIQEVRETPAVLDTGRWLHTVGTPVVGGRTSDIPSRPAFPVAVCRGASADRPLEPHCIAGEN